MSLTHYITKGYDNKSGLLTIEKQTQFMVSAVESTCGELSRTNKANFKRNLQTRVITRIIYLD